MKQTLFLFFSAFLLDQNAYSQVVLKGKVTSEAINLEGINVINLTNKQNAVTEKEGFFSISAKANDTLMFSGMQIKGTQIVLKETHFSESLFFMRLEPQINQLDEVTIKNYNKLNAVSLGIVSKEIKSYTPAERRLKTAGDFKAIHLLGLLGGSLPIDPILNKISGRTTMLKKEVEVEKNEKLLLKLSSMYEDVFYIEKLKIPAEYIRGFKIFSIDNLKVIESIKAKNIGLTTFLLSELAVNYLKQINEGK